VAGGSFNTWLPHPSTLEPEVRPRLLEEARTTATTLCIREVLRVAGLPDCEVPDHDPGGIRRWPRGYVGSLSHKGTVVLVALASTASTKALGLDLELFESQDHRSLNNLLPRADNPPNMEANHGVVIQFSAKEAVFKAQFPLTRRNLGFSDVELQWSNSSELTAEVQCGLAFRLQVRCLLAGPWILSVAMAGGARDPSV
jgi:4'-phosphopantetheinyl transferase EntD